MAEDNTSSILFIQGNGLVQTGNRRSLAGRQSRGEEKQGSLQATRASDGEKKLSPGLFIETNHVVAACKQLSLIFTSIRSPSRPREIKFPHLPEARGLNQRRQVEENRRKEFVRRTKDSRMTTLELLERKDGNQAAARPLGGCKQLPPMPLASVLLSSASASTSTNCKNEMSSRHPAEDKAVGARARRRSKRTLMRGTKKRPQRQEKKKCGVRENLALYFRPLLSPPSLRLRLRLASRLRPKRNKQQQPLP